MSEPTMPNPRDALDFCGYGASEVPVREVILRLANFIAGPLSDAVTPGGASLAGHASYAARRLDMLLEQWDTRYPAVDTMAAVAEAEAAEVALVSVPGDQVRALMDALDASIKAAKAARAQLDPFTGPLVEGDRVKVIAGSGVTAEFIGHEGSVKTLGHASSFSSTSFAVLLDDQPYGAYLFRRHELERLPR